MPPNSNSERQIRYDLDIEGTDKLIALTNITERFNVVLDKETNSIKMLKSVSAEYMKGQEKKQVVMAQGLAVDKKKTEQLIKEVPHLKAKNKELEKQVKLNTQMRPAGTSTTETVGQFGEKNVSTINKYADGMGNTRKEVVKTTQGLEKLSVWQKISGGHWDSAFPRITKVNNALNTLRWSMVNVAFAFAGVAALLTPFVLLTKYGMDLETQFKRVAVVTGATMEDAKTAILDLRAGTMFSIDEMGTSFLEFTKQGFSAEQAIQSMSAITSLAVTGFTTLDEATKIIGQTLHQFNLSATESSHVADVLAAAANESAADVETFGIAMSYAGPLAQQAGISFEETAAALAILSNQGLSASKSGTSFAAAMTQMISPSDSMIKKMRSVGLSFFNAKGEMKDINAIVKDLSASLSAMPDQERLKFLVDIFQTRGARAISGLMTSYESGKGTIGEFTDKISQQGYAMEKMLEVEQTTAAMIKTDWNDIKQTMVPAGEAMNNVLGDILHGLNKLLDYDWKTLKKNYKIAFGEDIGVKNTTTQKTIDILTRERNRIENTELFFAFDYKDRVSELDKEISTLEKWNKVKSEQVNALFRLKEQYDKNIMTGKSFGEEQFEEQKATEEYIIAIKEKADALIALESPTKENITLLVETTTATKDMTKNTEYMTTATEKLSSAEAKLEMEIGKVSIALNGAQNDFDDFTKSVEDSMKTTDEKKTQKYIDELTSQARKYSTGGDYYMAGMTAGTASYLSDQLDYLHRLEDQLEIYKADTEDLKTKSEQAQKALTAENDALKSLQGGLKGVESQLSSLSRTRFTGETEISQLISNIDKFTKEQDLSKRGITDVQGFLQASLAKSKDGYDALVDSIKSVTKETKSSKDEFTAWTDTINTFIKESISAGNDLGTNMSQTITQFQTQLLSTSKFEDSTTENEDAISLLKDAYDVYYGGMHDDVKYAIQAHEDQVNGVYATSEGVIAALQGQWVAQNNYNNSIIESEENVVSLQTALEKSQRFYDDYTKQVDSTTQAISNFGKKLDDIIMKLKKVAEAKGNLQDVIGGTDARGTDSRTIYHPEFTTPVNPSFSQNYVDPYKSPNYNDYITIGKVEIQMPGSLYTTPEEFANDMYRRLSDKAKEGANT